MEDSKHWLASKTLWVNVLALVAAAAGAFGIDVGLTPETQTAIVGGVLAIVNIGLRLLTSAPIRS